MGCAFVPTGLSVRKTPNVPPTRRTSVDAASVPPSRPEWLRGPTLKPALPSWPVMSTQVTPPSTVTKTCVSSTAYATCQFFGSITMSRMIALASSFGRPARPSNWNWRSRGRGGARPHDDEVAAGGVDDVLVVGAAVGDGADEVAGRRVQEAVGIDARNAGEARGRLDDRRGVASVLGLVQAVEADDDPGLARRVGGVDRVDGVGNRTEGRVSRVRAEEARLPRVVAGQAYAQVDRARDGVAAAVELAAREAAEAVPERVPPGDERVRRCRGDREGEGLRPRGIGHRLAPGALAAADRDRDAVRGRTGRDRRHGDVVVRPGDDDRGGRGDGVASACGDPGGLAEIGLLDLALTGVRTPPSSVLRLILTMSLTPTAFPSACTWAATEFGASLKVIAFVAGSTRRSSSGDR